MTPLSIFGPFLALMVLTFCVWVFMYIRRIRFIRRNKVNPRDLEKPGELERISPAEIVNPSNNLKNLFELPVLFYALVLYLWVTKQADDIYVLLAWIFVIFRVLHSIVHCTFNRVMVRFTLYAIAAVALWIMIGRAVIEYLLAPTL
jgi:hypothetical protein